MKKTILTLAALALSTQAFAHGSGGGGGTGGVMPFDICIVDGKPVKEERISLQACVVKYKGKLLRDAKLEEIKAQKEEAK